ncbi:MAG TPA: 16S rRNA (adenine(1518)-N(6)/adenine(1519)-N(6))-dimethyltransferase RsmA [Erysipelotrichaceae bacterium]|jgi:16S rRNA (adenine1518-N6/adenine1519-N6)-dimethyltransferase|nr:16S rRNA (adenine(1518)-N(6)/adenine(1519)-N(6))-dimethyltransferase RsmA [Erysipelotrichaceae bacterium]HQB32302.1 16S rRNA (adenine(1518)-N(6)/adenine(1519)-N(6))-dimethyltransferase RsmA [Erysipelotrichaceae bacterium]
MIGTRSKTNYILKKHNYRAKKKFGQNFLVEPNIIKKMVEQINEDSVIIEIGAGLGAITQAAALKAKQVIAYEIDTELVEILNDNLKEYRNIEIINEDFLKADLDKISDSYGQKVIVVSNLPYYITTYLLTKVLLSSDKIDRIIAMMQKEVADRFTRKEKGKDYNALQVMAEYYCDIKTLTKVSKNNFIPVPKVDSEILIFEIKENYQKVEDEKLLFDIVKACFSQRRKMILTNLNNNGFNIDKQELLDFGVDPASRVEHLELQDYIKIYSMIRQQL